MSSSVGGVKYSTHTGGSRVRESFVVVDLVVVDFGHARIHVCVLPCSSRPPLSPPHLCTDSVMLAVSPPLGTSGHYHISFINSTLGWGGNVSFTTVQSVDTTQQHFIDGKWNASTAR